MGTRALPDMACCVPPPVCSLCPNPLSHGCGGCGRYREDWREWLYACKCVRVCSGGARTATDQKQSPSSLCDANRAALQARGKRGQAAEAAGAPERGCLSSRPPACSRCCWDVSLTCTGAFIFCCSSSHRSHPSCLRSRLRSDSAPRAVQLSRRSQLRLVHQQLLRRPPMLPQLPLRSLWLQLHRSLPLQRTRSCRRPSACATICFSFSFSSRVLRDVCTPACGSVVPAW